MNYNRGDLVILPFPFVKTNGIQQKARPAIIISDHRIHRRFNDVILIGITSQRVDNLMDTEYLLDENTSGFINSGLKKASVVRCEFIMTIPVEIISRKIGKLSDSLMSKIDEKLKLSLGIK